MIVVMMRSSDWSSEIAPVTILLVILQCGVLTFVEPAFATAGTVRSDPETIPRSERSLRQDGQDRHEADREYLASVGGIGIRQAEVRLMLRQLRPSSDAQSQLIAEVLEKNDDGSLPQIPDSLKQAAIRQWIERLLVLGYLKNADYAATDEMVLEEWNRVVAAAQQQGRDLPGQWEQQGIDREAVMLDLSWRMSWENYVQQKITAETLEKYYELKRPEFDGTRLKVAHLFLAHQGAEGDLVKQVDDWKTSIEQGKLAFESVVKQHSQGSTAQQGGILGWIGFDGPMGRAFTDTAFATRVGDVSEVVKTDQGIHLIKVLEMESGQIPFSECRDQVRVSAVNHLWNLTVDQQRKNVSIQNFTESRTKSGS